MAQPTSWDNFSYEDDSESQEEENDSRSQVSQREHLIIKTQEVWVNEEFEDDLQYRIILCQSHLPQNLRNFYYMHFSFFNFFVENDIS